MARLLKLDIHAARRNEILDAALGLVMSKGYERMTVGAILTEVGMSSGAFYHYFGSKPAVLEALVERIVAGSEPALTLLVDDPGLSAIDKLQGFFDVISQLRSERRRFVLEVLSVWRADHNAIVRQKVEAAMSAVHAGLLCRIAVQGVAEGAFAGPVGPQTGAVLAALVAGMSSDHMTIFLNFDPQQERRFIEAVAATHTAYMSAIERVLGAPVNTLRRLPDADVSQWTAALKTRS